VGGGIFVLGRGSTRYKCVAFVPIISPGTNVNPHLYEMVCTGSITDTNEGYEPVQITVFPIVRRNFETSTVLMPFVKSKKIEILK
jgi:hypothetical protein